MRLKDKVAVVTGGSSGIGRAISILFCQQGAKVAVFDIQPESRLADETPDVMTAIKNISGTADYYSVDVTNLSQVNSAVDTVLEKWGGNFHSQSNH
jgi:3-hydroxybutyrate dehydrogenase